MSNPIPNLLALTSIADGSPQQAAPLRNNYSAIQAAVNALATALKGGTAGALLYATDLSDVAYLPDAPADGNVLVWNAAASRWKPAANTAGAGTELDYAQITTPNAAVSATTEGTAVVQITGNSIAYDGTKVRLEFFIPRLTCTVGQGNVTFVLLRDTTVLGQISKGLSNSSDINSMGGVLYDTPAAGAHTYKLSLFVGGNSATVGAGAGGSGNLVPAFLRTTKA